MEKSKVNSLKNKVALLVISYTCVSEIAGEYDLLIP